MARFGQWISCVSLLRGGSGKLKDDSLVSLFPTP